MFHSFPFSMTSDDLPELQEVVEDQSSPIVFQVAVCVSHQERDAHTHTAPPDTHWLTQLAHIATGPQSPLLQGSTYSRLASEHTHTHIYTYTGEIGGSIIHIMLLLRLVSKLDMIFPS